MSSQNSPMDGHPQASCSTEVKQRGEAELEPPGFPTWWRDMAERQEPTM